jgi:methionine-rich copper-binding protein CopC
MKKSILLIAAVGAIFAGTAFDILEDNGKAGYTGSPNELLCDDCHSSFSGPNVGGGTIYLTSTMSNWQYVPGQTYTINAIVKHVGRPLFGLGLEALTSTNANAGTLQITNSVKTQIKTKTVSGVTRNNVVHKLNGGLTADSMVFTFNWVAPATNVGNITFYFAGVAANNDGDEANDYVYNSTKLVTPASATGLMENSSPKSAMKLYVNAENNIVLNYSSAVAASPKVEIYDLAGHLIVSRSFDQESAGEVKLEVERPLNIQPGVYLINLISGTDIFGGKILLNNN